MSLSHLTPRHPEEPTESSGPVPLVPAEVIALRIASSPEALRQLGEAGPLSWSHLLVDDGMPVGPGLVTARGGTGDTIPVDRLLSMAALAPSSWERAAAVRQLLDRAASDPFYLAADGERHDLRRGLPVLLAELLGGADVDPFGAELRRGYLALEQATLRLVLRRAVSTGYDLDARSAWRVIARVFAALTRTPRPFGALFATAEALDGIDAEVAPSHTEDPLHPRTFVGVGAPDFSRFAWMAAFWVHHHRSAERRRDPWSSPVVSRWLTTIAARTSTEGERAQEDSLARLPVSDWPGAHIAAPILARWLLTRARVPWLAEVPTSAFEECVAQLREAPARHLWLCSAAMRDAARLDDSARRSLRDTWRRLPEETPGHMSATLAVAFVAHLESTEDLLRLGAELAKASPAWLPFILEALLDASVSASVRGVGELGLAKLRELVERTEVDAQVRVNAAVIVAQRYRALPWVDRGEVEAWFLRVSARPPLAENLSVRRERQRIEGLAVRG